MLRWGVVLGFIIFIAGTIWARRYDEGANARPWLIPTRYAAFWIGGFELWIVSIAFLDALFSGAIPEVAGSGRLGALGFPLADPAQINDYFIVYLLFLIWRVIVYSITGAWFGVFMRGLAVAYDDIKTWRSRT